MHILDWTDTVIQGHNSKYAGYPSSGMFTLTFDNSRQRGFGESVKSCTCEGVLYASGHCHIDTNKLLDEEAMPMRDFTSIWEMKETLRWYGNYKLVWHERGCES